MLRLFQLGHRIGLGPTLGLWVAWLAANVLCARAIAEMLGPTWALVVAVGVGLIAATGGLVGFWIVASLVEYQLRGYRVTWIVGDRWGYEERGAHGLPLVYRREVRASGYPQPCTIHPPSDTAWSGAPWTEGRRAEVLRRILDAHGASRGGDVVLADASPSPRV